MHKEIKIYSNKNKQNINVKRKLKKQTNKKIRTKGDLKNG